MTNINYKNLTTLFLLIILIAVRAPVADLIINITSFFHLKITPRFLEDTRSLQDFTYFFWDNLSFLVALSIIIINRANLSDLNIDKSFAVILLIGIGNQTFQSFYPFGWVVLIFSLILYLLYKKEFFTLKDTSKTTFKTIGLVLIVYFSFVLRYEFTYVRYNVFVDNEFDSSIIDIPFTLTEELIFRGFLWMYLKNLNFHETVIIIFQAILFWLFHIYVLPSSPLSFWIYIPIMSLILGIITSYSKSLSPSTLAHFLYNSL